MENNNLCACSCFFIYVFIFLKQVIIFFLFFNNLDALLFFQGYKPPDEGPSEYQTIPLNKIEDFGVHCKQ